MALPLFISIDQEGGTVIRIGEGVTVFPGNMALGALGREQEAYQAGRAMAIELAELGFNMNLAPVLDVNNNPANPIIGIRSYGEDPETVSRLGVATIKGMQDAGILATAKHFPGHGDTAADSHLSLPLVPHGWERLDAIELKPFRAAIANGVACIMTAHVVFPAIEPEPGRPATLSWEVLTGLLRNRLGFDGLIMTDCMEMGAIAANFEIGEATVQAVLAGADQVLISHSLAKQKLAYEALMAATESGMLPLARIDEAVSRILRRKLELQPQKPKVSLQRYMPLKPREEQGHLELARQIAGTALTLVRNDKQVLPLRLPDEAEVRIISFQKPLTVVETHDGVEVDLAGIFGRYHAKMNQTVLAADPDASTRQELIATLGAQPPALLIVASQDAGSNPGQADLVRQLGQQGIPTVVIALRTPYDLAVFPEVDTYVTAYGFRRVTLEALAQLLWGEMIPGGKLPVEIPGLYPVGYGMEHF
ncbi:MAG TPA: glycoside hydrolase family 3 N-terminal domain-containing protein [Armatimonadota bacterium]|nr:glycoside hydrolase family 3 N-terminal domain-containing protein [Armatimonadota bacterium]